MHLAGIIKVVHTFQLFFRMCFEETANGYLHTSIADNGYEEFKLMTRICLMSGDEINCSGFCFVFQTSMNFKSVRFLISPRYVTSYWYAPIVRFIVLMLIHQEHLLNTQYRSPFSP